ncbi:MAG: penicillin-binding protein 2 [Gallionellales bacterium CG_4_10_14_3_um_filter_54_96]|nr:penicillin-binding protein 2 [Gallionella sp.]OIO77288.1 MAG: penicillin-binding protein 2 [Gallionellaceae bacterium CG1_02_56_997]PIV91595.1 MAG: penicillin-binding protein 2 [Gallionellales bacterium CG17_big_fil_post_rev_8_21_14_2_50_54_146]PIX05224.1 MAG: penicillin-binding protein 2 [Gallionellales bacterium CG_4_8_14_3_um_filter_54_18]PIY03697.1 MAG: penicillin-binding protein 2 [Gallionellales bacterium CG_4_10_14_3_um_filter_54_96]PJC05526.1 MAG: penicillin-binding protein 2 [Galli
MNDHVALKNHQQEIFNFRLRLVIGVVFVLILLGILAARFVYLQAVRYDYYHTMAENNRISVVPIVPNRGLILDRHGIVLAHNYSGYTLEITPSKVKNLQVTINELATLVDIAPRDRKRFKQLLAESHNFETLVIRNRLSDEEVARFAAQQYRFPGVEIKARLFRDYPFSDKTAHLLGYIGRMNQRDVDRLEEADLAANYRGTDYIGKTGLEQYYESELHGTTGMEQVEVDSAGRAARILSRTLPVSGNTLVLSIDAKLQEIAEQAFGDYRGALVAIDPANGEVLAFVSRPGFDPSLFIDGIDEENWRELNNSPDHPLNNRVLSGQYPSGSTIKPFMALAALHYGTRSPTDTISDPGYYALPGTAHHYRDWKKGGHGTVDMFKSIVVSCDTYYYGLAVATGIDNIAAYLTNFSFGKKTGIDLQGEKSGLLPNTEWKMKRFKQKWFAGDTVSVGIGQGYSLVTPLQLAAATATLANGGIAYRPHLVREVRNSVTNETRKIDNPVEADLKIDPAHLDLIRRAMAAVTQPGGTAVSASAGAPYTIAGKTGTAQVVAMKQGEKYDASKIDERHRDHAWFISFAPVEKPRIAVVVLAENGGHGGGTAAPIARKVLDYYLLGKVPKPAEVPVVTGKTAAVAASGVPEVEVEHD